jgi:hypothetical protein
MTYDQFFQQATASPAPYGYQARLASGDTPQSSLSFLLSASSSHIDRNAKTTSKP